MMHYRRTPAAALALGVLVMLSATMYVSATPKSIQYVGSVRDFSQLHNDFEGIAGSDGPQTNMLLTSLNSKNQTVFRPPVMRTTASTKVNNQHCYGSGNSKTSNASMANWGQFFWDEHYQDVPGVNIALPVVITLTQNLTADPTGTLYFMDDQFYHPINQRGFGLREQLTLDGPDSCCLSPLNPQNLTRNINMWFTAEFTIPFYYRNQSEVFQFNGDDDLYVFIDNRLVCDLGGIHQKTDCDITLNSALTDVGGSQMNLALGLHQMKIFYAERHTAGSHLKITTSILPTNTPPVAYNSVATFFKASTGAIVPRVFDADGDKVRLLFQTLPANGVLSVYNTTTKTTVVAVPNTWYDLSTATFNYAPTGLFCGDDSITFLPNDGQANATAPGTVSITVIDRDLPPVPTSINVNVYSDVISYIRLSATDPDQNDTSLFAYAVAGGSSCSLGGCTLPCVCTVDGTGARTSDCLAGVSAPANSTQATFLKYVPVNLGTDTLNYIAYDGSTWSTEVGVINVGISCDASKPKCTSAGDTSGSDPRGSDKSSVGGGSLAGIIAGAAVAATLLGGALAYLAYYKLAAARFEKAWERDWAQAQISENPMYKSNVKEAFNPLYVESAT